MTPLWELIWVEPENMEEATSLIETPERWVPKPATGRVVRPSAETARIFPAGTNIAFEPRSLMEATIDGRKVHLLSKGEILAIIDDPT